MYYHTKFTQNSHSFTYSNRQIYNSESRIYENKSHFSGMKTPPFYSL